MMLRTIILSLALTGAVYAETLPPPPPPHPLRAPVEAPLTTSTCIPHAEMQARLAEFGEKVVAMDVAEGGVLVELYIAPGGGWSIVTTSPDGMACLRLFGRELNVIAPAGRRGA